MTLPMVPTALFGGGVNTLYTANDTIPYSPASIRGTWSFTTTAFSRKLSVIPTGAGTSTGRTESPGQAGTDHTDRFGRFGTGPMLSNVTISGQLTGVFGTLNSVPSNDTIRFHIFVTAGSTDTLRGTLYNTADQGAFRNPAAGRAFTVNLSSVSAQTGDHIIFEMGGHWDNGANQNTLTYYYGGTSSISLGDGDTNVTTRPGWVRFVNVALPLAS